MSAPLQLTASAYHADTHCPEPSLSSTMMKTLITETPLDAWCDSQRLNPNWEAPEDGDFDVGHAAHSLVLGTGSEFVEIPGDVLGASGSIATKAAKEFIAEAREGGLIPLKPKHFDAVHAYADAVNTALKSIGITLDPARSELAAYAQLDGVWNRMQADNAPIGVNWLMDLKTTAGSVHPDELVKTVVNLRYDIPAVHYPQVWNAATGENRHMRFVFVSKPAGEKKKNRVPQVGMVELYDDGAMRVASDYAQDEMYSADWIADATHDVTRARGIFRRCLDTGEWPGYPMRTALLGAPAWHRRNRAAVQAGS